MPDIQTCNSKDLCDYLLLFFTTIMLGHVSIACVLLWTVLAEEDCVDGACERVYDEGNINSQSFEQLAPEVRTNKYIQFHVM